MYLPITAHGLIGDLHTAALVGQDGRLVWLPWPRFDSPALFAALLDDQRGGVWELAPLGVTVAEQRYDDETAILLTRFEAAGGTAELRDWMSPWQGPAPGHDLWRVMRCTAGEIEVVSRLEPRAEYGRVAVKLEQLSAGELGFQAHGLRFFVRSNHGWRLDGDAATLRVRLQAGEELVCVLCSGSKVALAAMEEDYATTRRFWQDWVDQCSYVGPWATAVRRSAITLKLLTYAPTGAIIAAPTTSLPEWIGGMRNWDYRYTWLRDGSWTLAALFPLGYRTEAQAFFAWLGERCAQQPLQIMYGIGGEAELHEQVLEHLSGYRDSRPVRIGNAAFAQRQLDVYGGVLDAAWQYEQHGELLTAAEWERLRTQVEYVQAHWQEPDQGIWEIRGPAAQHVFSKVMCWVTLDRAVRLAEQERWAGDVAGWAKTRDAIKAQVLREGWNEATGTFTQSYGSTALDASLLMLPMVEFVAATDPRMLATIAAIKEQLSVGPLVYRYNAPDHLPPGEGSFVLCGFWLVEALALSGAVTEAQERFAALVGFASEHGLLSEEVDPQHGAALGNYPQAFSHIGLINAALRLAQLEATESA